MKENEPKIVCFSCRFSWGYLVNEEDIYAQVENWIPIICTGKIDPVHILTAFRNGAEGVLILGCPEGECHYQDGNIEAKKRISLLYSIIESYGIDRKRLKLHLGTDPEGKTIRSLVKEMAEDILKLGPCPEVSSRKEKVTT
jgi:coenzyme F420-reducing hydrogenase delta subunit